MRLATTWQELLDNPEAEKIRLVELNPAIYSNDLGDWTESPMSYGNNIYTLEYDAYDFTDMRISDLQFDTTKLTRVTPEQSANFWAGLMDNAFESDEASGEVHVRFNGTLTPADFTFSLTGIKLFISTHPDCLFTPEDGTYPIYYEPVAKSVPLMSASADQYFFASAQIDDGTIVIHNGVDSDYGDYGIMDAQFFSYIWKNRPVKVYTGGEALPLSEYQLTYTGYIDAMTWGETEITITTKSAMRFLEKKIPAQTFTKSYVVSPEPVADYETYTFTYLPDGMDGAAVPILLGTCYNVPMTLVHYDEDYYYYVVACHAIKSVLRIREGGISIYEDGDDFYDAVLHDTMPVADIDEDSAIIKMKFSNITGGVYTCDVEGYTPDSGTTFPETYTDIGEVLLETFGEIDADIVDLQALATTTYKLGVAITTETKLNDVLNMMDASVLAWHGASREGKIVARKWQPVEETYSPGEAEEYDFDLDVSEPEFEISYMQLYKTVKIGYAKNYTVQSDTAPDPMNASSQGIKEDWSFDYRWVENDNEQVKTIYDTDETRLIETYLADQTDAEAVSEEYNELFQYPWLTVKFKSQLRPLTSELGDIILLDMERFMVDSKYIQVIGIEEDGEENTTMLTCFRLLGV